VRNLSLNVVLTFRLDLNYNDYVHFVYRNNDASKGSDSTGKAAKDGELYKRRA
jgi:hypothetical protein